MRHHLAIWLTIFLCTGTLFSQTTYLNRPQMMAMADSCIRHTYNFSFERARHFQQILDITTPDHPAPSFLEALIIYWEHFPLTPEDSAAGQFVELMDQSVSRAELMLELDSTHLEGVFFDLFGRAFKAMFWADNGKSGKVISDLGKMYSHTKEGFEMKEDFAEFYFSTGLYNYYIEAYPEAHPGYRPLVAFMHDGDRELGLVQLSHAINHTVFLRVEALLFMSLIQLNYENNLDSAALYAERLHAEFPKNVFYQGHLTAILLHQHRYSRVREIIEGEPMPDGTYQDMIGQLSGAFMAEMEVGNHQSAEKKYLNVIDLAGSIGPFANNYRAMGYMGLSRLYEKSGAQDEARKYAKKASRYTAYGFILDEK